MTSVCHHHTAAVNACDTDDNGSTCRHAGQTVSCPPRHHPAQALTTTMPVTTNSDASTAPPPPPRLGMTRRCATTDDKDRYRNRVMPVGRVTRRRQRRRRHDRERGQWGKWDRSTTANDATWHRDASTDATACHDATRTELVTTGIGTTRCGTATRRVTQRCATTDVTNTF